MAVDLQKFASTATELYELWPALFNWLGGIVGGALVFIVTGTWWMRAYVAERDVAILKKEKATVEGEKVILKGQFDAEKVVLNGRLESEIKALNAKSDAEKTAAQGQIQVLEQRLRLAAEQNAAAKEEAERAKNQLNGLKEMAGLKGALTDFQIATIDLDTSFDKILNANTAVTKTLTSIPIHDIEVLGADNSEKGSIKLPILPLKPS